MIKMKDHLVSKNVAVDIADKLCASLQETLIGKKPGSFKTVHAMVKESMEPALQRILTPRVSTDILRYDFVAFLWPFCGNMAHFVRF